MGPLKEAFRDVPALAAGRSYLGAGVRRGAGMGLVAPLVLPSVARPGSCVAAGRVLREQSGALRGGQGGCPCRCSVPFAPARLPGRQRGTPGGPEHSHQSQVACAAVSASGLEGEDRARVRSTCVKCCEQLPAGRGHSAPAGPLLLALGKRVTPASHDFLRFPPRVLICLLPGSPEDEMR